MSTSTDTRDWYRQQFRTHKAELPGACLPWLNKLRAQALERFMESGFPTLKHEDWKYTDVRPIAMCRLAAAAVGALPPAELLAPFALDAHELVFVDGRYAPRLSHPGTLPPGVRVASLAEVLAGDASALEPWFSRHARPEEGGFAALNATFLRDGAYVHLRRNTEVEPPIHLLFVSTSRADTVAHTRNLIVAEPGSRATVVESYVGLGDGAYLTNAVTEIAAEAGSVLEHYRLQREGEGAWHVGGTHVHQSRDSRYTSHAVALGARLARHELGVALDAEGTECVLNGLYATRARQHVDNHTRIDHLKPHGTSREWYKGVLDGASRGVFSGRIVVHPQAQHTDAEQNNRNLLLSPDAEADSRPQFEIYADDVKCAHGSAEGSLDLDQLFYLRSRGLDEPLARSLLVYAFAADVLARMRLVPVRVQLERQLARRLLPTQPLEELIA
jgi:Fe-S cluster assembly protein SufD